MGAVGLPVDETSERTQLANEHLPKSDPRRDILRVRKRTDANTAVLYAYSDSVRVGNGSRLSGEFSLHLEVRRRRPFEDRQSPTDVGQGSQKSNESIRRTLRSAPTFDLTPRHPLIGGVNCRTTLSDEEQQEKQLDLMRQFIREVHGHVLQPVDERSL
jgi:hypothetical protein